ncbi:MAG: hypothetical protein CMA64_07200 [Euryarchaeota archaeon]|nr:hypothetical protein [Euryarchaeota archaeon]
MIKEYQFESVNRLEIDITSYCNASCGACGRNKNGGKRYTNIPLQHFKNWDKLITKENLEYIEEIIFDGNFGDFQMHPGFIDLINDLAKVKTNLRLVLHTNGGARNPTFWKQLAHSLKPFAEASIDFGIDGNKETNHIYRRGVNWESLMRNVKAFNDAGGVSIWKTIVFEYNKDQLNEIQELAREIGCYGFITNRNHTSRPITLDKYRTYPSGNIESPPLKEYNKKYKISADFKPWPFPLIKIGMGPGADVSYPKASYNPVTKNNQRDPKDSQCPYGERGMIHVDHMGDVWPCCWFGDWRSPLNNFDLRMQIPEVWKGQNNIAKHSLKEICTMFRPKLGEAWNTGSLQVCNDCNGKKHGLAPIYS